jgi:hypothetical protein
MAVKPLAWSCAAALVLVSASSRGADFFADLAGDPLGPIASPPDWTNYIRLDDLDGDGDLDVIMPNCTGFFKNPQPQPFRIFLNDGKAVFTASSPFTAAIRVVDLGDIDGDGDLDLYAPSASGALDRLLINDGKGKLVDEAASRLPSGLSSHSAATRFGDVDGDGDVDLLVAGGYAFSESPSVKLFVNDGNGKFSDATAQLPAIAPSEIDDVDFFDADRDFDLDLLVNSHNAKPALWLNDGSGKFSNASAQLGTAGFGLKYGPAPCDVDGDGDLDIWIDNAGTDANNKSNYTEQLLINDGKGNFKDETFARVKGNSANADDNLVVCADVDLDGDFDAIVGSLSNVERVLLNDGKGNFTNVGGFTSVSDPTLWLDAGDLDGDGRLDAVTGQGEGANNRKGRVYLGTADNPVDNRAPAIVAAQKPSAFLPNKDIELRFAVSDRVSSDGGPRVRAFVRAAIDGGMASEIPARFMGGDLFRAMIPMQKDGASVVVELCAEDKHKNLGCAPKHTIAITSSAAATGAGGAGGGGASATAGSGSGGATSAATATGAGGAEGDKVIIDKPGCGCRVARSLSGPARWSLLALAAALAARRRGQKRTIIAADGPQKP